LRGKFAVRSAVKIILIPVILVILSHSVLAEQKNEADQPWERFVFNFGGFTTNMSSSVRVGTFVGLDVDVEKALGLDDSMRVFRADALYRFGKTRRHRLDFSWAAYHRSGTTTTSQEIPTNPPIPSGTGIETRFDYDIIQLKYSYSLFQDDRMDLGFGIGLYGMPIEAEIRNANTGKEFLSEDFIAPLPVFAFRGDFLIIPKLYFKLNIDFFYIEIDKFTGDITDARLALEYNIWEHLGVGLAYDSFDARIKAEEGTEWPGIDFIGKIELEYSGLLLYAKLYF
jgi:hypothetical protein